MSKENNNRSCSGSDERLSRQKCREERIRDDRGETLGGEVCSPGPDKGLCKQDCVEAPREVKLPGKHFLEHEPEFKKVVRNCRIGVGVVLSAFVVGGQMYQHMVVKPRTEEMLRLHNRADTELAEMVGVRETSARLCSDPPVAFRSSIHLASVEDLAENDD